MVKVDDKRVLVPEAGVPVGMAMRLRSLPTLMRVPMVLVVEMRMLVLKRIVKMFHLIGVVSRP